MKEKLNEIQNIENKYGLVLFRMGLSHLVDTGHRNISDGDIEAGIQQIMAKGEEDTANGKIPVMTPEFQCEILRCATELTRYSIWALFAYIKKYVEVGSL